MDIFVRQHARLGMLGRKWVRRAVRRGSGEPPCSADLPTFGGAINAICPAPSARITTAGAPSSGCRGLVDLH